MLHFNYSATLQAFPGFTFYKTIPCNESMWWYTDSTAVAIFDVSCICVNYALIVMGLILNTISFMIYGRQDSESLMSLILRFVAVVDQCVLVLNGYDALAHISEIFSDKFNHIMLLNVIYVHPMLWIFQVGD